MSAPIPRPVITVHNRQRSIGVEVASLQEFAERVLEASLQLAGKNAGKLLRLGELSVILVSDRRIAELHRRFMNLPGPTDVITFQHGEIFISIETARRNGRRVGTSLGHELRLYITHGLLHLLGYDDKDRASAAAMERVQDRLVAEAGGGESRNPKSEIRNKLEKAE